MNQKFANLISIVFHPLLLATYLFTAFILINPMIALPPGYNHLAQWLIVLVVALTTFVIPALSIIMLKFTGSIRSLKLEGRKERFVPFMYITAFYGFTAYYFSRQLLVTDLAEAIFILTAIMIFIAALINTYWKISIHSLGIGGIVGILLVLALVVTDGAVKYLLVGAILISGLVLWARLELDAHSPAQVYAGYVLGLFVSFMLILWI